jgi:L-aspartate oxidase
LLDEQGVLHEVRARAVLLASGGAGQVYSETTNPAVATGDGIAMAYRAGAELMDMEFMQFHPTAFAHPGAPRFLMSEALRGEGALLVNTLGERFMARYDPRLELAPRDVVARAIVEEALDSPVYLDMRQAAVGKNLKARFPGISAFLAQYGLELAHDLIPVLPAAHYLMGGVRTDTHGRTSLRGLYAAGEAACTGVHGANRLASNSLLEGLVFGARAAGAMAEEMATAGPQSSERKRQPSVASTSLTSETEVQTGDIEQWITRLRSLMWRDAGLRRSGEVLHRAQAELAILRENIPSGTNRRALEARNLHSIAEVMVDSALLREESRGAHFRTDFPQHDAVAKHSIAWDGQLSFVEV